MATITIRDVPDSAVRGLERKAAFSGMGLQDYLLDLLAREVALPDVSAVRPPQP